MFDQIELLLLVAAAAGVVALRLRQPILVGFIGIGILAGPSAMGWVTQTDQIHVLGKLGLSLLLFVVGLKLDLQLIRSMGMSALIIGFAQVTLTTALGFALVSAFGMPPLVAAYASLALTFTSTIITIKLLSDKSETDSLHGKITVGLLIVQDLIVILVMIGLSAVDQESTGSVWLGSLLIVARGAALLAGLGLLMVLVFPKLLPRLAKSPEMLVLFSIAWAVGMSSLTDQLGFSKEVGAFLAGIGLASTEYREMLSARLIGLRDFLLLFFFVELGVALDINTIGANVWEAVPLSILVLVFKPLIMLLILGFMGYGKRTSFLASINVAPVSEFSLILLALGIELGHISDDLVGLITLVALISIMVSTYLIMASARIYTALSNHIGPFVRGLPFREQERNSQALVTSQADAVVFGLGHYGAGIASELRQCGRMVLGVDFDPQAVRKWTEGGGMAWYGDAEDPEFPKMLPLEKARWVISTVPDTDVNVSLIKSLQTYKYQGNVAVAARREEDVEDLREASPDLILKPFEDASAEAVDLLVAAEVRETRRKMDTVIEGLSGHCIVCGYGRMGQQIVADFRRHGVEHVVVEDNPEQLPKLLEGNIPFVEGKASDDDVLIRAGVERAKSLISVAATEEENVFIVLTARGLNLQLHIVARSIREENEDKLLRAGANRVMSPYMLGGSRMAVAVISPRVTDFLDQLIHSDRLDIEIGDLIVAAESGIVGKTLKAAQIRNTCGVTVLAIKRAGEDMHGNPDADFEIAAGDELIVIGTKGQIDTAEGIITAR